MSLALTPAQIEQQLIALGVPREKARQQAGGVQTPERPSGPALMGVTFRVPWSLLVSDNDKYTASYTKGGSPRILIKPRYREGKRRIADLSRTAMEGSPPMDTPLALLVDVWLPDARIHDIVNFSKIVQDAMEGIVFVNDTLIHDAHWRRAGVNVDAPGATLQVRRLPLP